MADQERALVSQKAARRISPSLFLLALLCFFLPFVGVSCNTAAATSTINSLSSGSSGSPGSSSSSGSSSTSAATACLAAIGSKNIITYSGFQLTTNAAPSDLSEPAGCSSTAATSGNDTSDETLGFQPLAAAAAVLIIGGLFVGALAFRRRGLITAGLALAALMCAVAESMWLNSNLLSVLFSKSATDSASAGEATPFLSVNAGIGYLVLLAVLVVACGYNVLAYYASERTAAPPETAAT